MGRVVQFEHLGALDGPGLRSVIFLAGCPIRCKFCHNADMLDPRAGREMTVEAVLAETARYADYCTGGVTLSGGEPLLQTEFAIGLLSAYKAAGVHTALDTAGTVYSEAALTLADIVLLDIKHTSPEGFYALTGGDMAATLQTLAYLRAHRKRFWIRQVMVEGITDREEQLLRLKEMAAGAEKIELLPYHTMGAGKWSALGIEPPLKGMRPFDGERLKQCYKIINEN